MSRVFDALSQAEEFRVAELRAQVSRIVQESYPSDTPPKVSSESAAETSIDSSAADLFPDGLAEREGETVSNEATAKFPASVTSIVEYAPPAPSEESRKRLQAALATAIEDLVLAECRRINEQKLRHQMRELWAKESIKFASQLEQEFNRLLGKASARHDMMSNQIARKFCESLHDQMSLAVTALTSWMDRKREALELEFQKSFSRFSQQAGEITAENITNQQRESKALSADLSSRLQRAAHALEEAGILSAGAN